jgi:hypothetical protein
MKSENTQKQSIPQFISNTPTPQKPGTNFALKSPRAQKRANKWFLAQQIKLEQGCADCGYDKSAYALQFDHISGVKKSSVSDLIRRDYSWKTILEEIEKCEVVCGNCHAIRTHELRPKNLTSSSTSQDQV